MNFRPNPLLYGAHEDFLSSFKIVVAMREEVDFDLLVKSVHSAMKRYPYFCVSPQRCGEDIQLQSNDAPVPVFRDGRCVVLGTDESNGHLIAFGCDGKNVVLHISHYIADGMGAIPTLLSVLYLYVSEKYGTEGLVSEKILLPDSPVSEGEYCYPFPEKPVLAEVEKEKKAGVAYSLDSDAFDNEGLYAYHLKIPQSAMMSVANPSDGSPASFLSIMLFRALCELDKDIEEPVIVHVQHQYRAAIKAPLSRHSLVSYVPVTLSPAIKNRDVEMQNTIVRGQIILGSEPEEDIRAVDRLVSAFSNNETLADKQTAMRKFIDDSTQPKTFGISYVGKMNWFGMDRYVEDVQVYIGEKHTPNMLLIEVMTIGEDFSINFMQSGRGRRYVDAFMRQLTDLNIPVSLVGEERFSLCDTKIPR